MKHLADDDFWKAYYALPVKVRNGADKAYKLLKLDPRHPSLHFKKIGHRWSARVGIHHRALAIEVEDGLLWYWIGPHDEYERLIR